MYTIYQRAEKSFFVIPPITAIGLFSLSSPPLDSIEASEDWIKQHVDAMIAPVPGTVVKVVADVTPSPILGDPITPR